MARKRRPPGRPEEHPSEPAAAAPPEPRDHRFVFALAAVAGVAFLLRLGVALELRRAFLFDHPQLDSFEFLTWARSIASGEPWPAVPTHAPGYPYFLGWLLAFCDGSLIVVRGVQAAFGAALCVLTGLLAKRAFGERAGVVAAVLVALYGPLIYLEVSLLAEGLFTFWLVLSLWLQTSERRSLPRALGGGVALGLAAVFRATALPLLPAMALWAAFDRKRPRRLTAATLLLAGGLAVVLPALVKVREVSGGWLPLQAFGGLNFYMGNRTGAPGTPAARLGGGWDLLSSEPLRQGIENPAEQERYFFRKALSEIGQHPGGALAALGRKALWLVSGDEIRESHSFYFFRQSSWLLRLLPGFSLLFPLALCGLVLAIRARSLPLPWAIHLGWFTLSCLLIVVSARYRIPLMPLLAALAGAAVVHLYETVRRRGWREPAGWGLLFAAGFAATLVSRHEPSRNPAEELALTAYSLESAGDLEKASAAARRAREADGGSALAWAVSGGIALRQGDRDAALTAFGKAVALDPDYQRARYNLGEIHRARGDLEAASRDLERAVWLRPDDLPAVTALAAVHLARARAAGAARRPAEGVGPARKAAELQPENPEAWMTLAFLALDAGEAAAAREALSRARPLPGPHAPAVAYGEALLDRLEGDPQAADRRLRELLSTRPDFRPARGLLLANAAALGRAAEARAFLAGLPPA